MFVITYYPYETITRSDFFFLIYFERERKRAHMHTSEQGGAEKES